MNALKLVGRIGLAAGLSLSFALFLPAVSAADNVAEAGQILLVSDEINGQSVEVVRTGGSAPGDNSSAGLGDGTNPGMGDGRDNATVGGTDNPNNAPR